MQQQKKAAAFVLLNQTASMTASAHVQLQLFFSCGEKKIESNCTKKMQCIFATQVSSFAIMYFVLLFSAYF